MPRKSAASLSVITPLKAGPIVPPEGASAEIRAIFREIVGRVPIEHFKPSDAPLVEQYGQAIALARQAYTAVQSEGPVIQGRANPWVAVLDKAHRSSVAFSARLRLSPQHRTDPKTAGRARGPAPSVYDTMEIDP